MANLLALPHRYKTVDLLILVPAIFCWMLWSFEIYIFPFLKSEKGGGLLGSHSNYAYIGETIFTGWAVLLNYIFLLIVNWVYLEDNLLQVVIYNMFTVLFISVVWFNIACWKNNSLTAEQ